MYVCMYLSINHYYSILSITAIEYTLTFSLKLCFFLKMSSRTDTRELVCLVRFKFQFHLTHILIHIIIEVNLSLIYFHSHCFGYIKNIIIFLIAYKNLLSNYSIEKQVHNREHYCYFQVFTPECDIALNSI